ncbi:hypothetical protein NPIL_491361 [Nephila pilipes]|uniref:Uncharacterized protein n=1 Tax=Nephila pilipes TaxID=299642 RepID=A0A8X6MH80_NEPPI|nr:hypothetical protein NPIL_491361 [Nephila pilipes]
MTENCLAEAKYQDSWKEMGTCKTVQYPPHMPMGFHCITSREDRPSKDILIQIKMAAVRDLYISVERQLLEVSSRIVVQIQVASYTALLLWFSFCT